MGAGFTYIDFGFILLTILGLSLFEIITSIDNAIINAEVLRGMSQKARSWFLLWGFLFAVFAVRGLLPLLIVWFALQEDPMLAFAAVVGSTAFFIIHGFRQFAEEQERKLIAGNMSDISKIAYLEVLDSTFSIDGVIGAFAFTFSIPLILLGNGLGALVLRKLTVSNIERIKNTGI